MWNHASENGPGPGGVVNAVGVLPAAEGGPGVKAPVLRKREPGAAGGQVQMVFRDEIQQVGRAEGLLLFTESVRQVQGVDALLIRHDDAAVVRHAAGHPVVSADGLKPPEFLRVLKTDAVHLISAVTRMQFPQPQHALPGGTDVGQGQGHQVLLADAALHQGVRPQDPGVGGDGLRGGHGHVGGVDAGGGPDALLLGAGVGGGGVALGVVGQVDLHLGDVGDIVPGLVLRPYHRKAFGGKMTGGGILVPGHQGGAVGAGVFSYQNGCAGHGSFYLLEEKENDCVG